LKKEKRRLVVDGEDIYWVVDGKRLSKNIVGDLQKILTMNFLMKNPKLNFTLS
tara:strand:- start:455 stop:613 length:159 start_codon:yes stop_codon:yes gene_type:complete